MTDLANIIKSRRSIRRYLEKDIPDAILEKMLEAVRWGRFT